MNRVRVGAARVCITPPKGTPMAGHYYRRFTKGVIDDIYATALAFADELEMVVYVSLELCELLHKEWVDNCKKEISDLCEISPEKIIISCTHTHTGPIVGDDIANDVESNKTYDSMLIYKIRDAVKSAVDNMMDAKFYSATNTVKDVAFYRIYRMKDGSIKTNPGVSNPDILCPLSQPDETLTIIKISRGADKDIIIANYGLHPDTIGGELISADWPGVLRETIERIYPDTYFVFMQGCEGNINTTDVRWKKFYKDYTRAQKVGHKMAGGVLQVMDEFVEFPASEISFSHKKIRIPVNRENHRLEDAERIAKLHASGKDNEITSDFSMVTTIVAEALRIINLKDAPDFYEAEIAAFKIGDVAILSLPGEPFCEIGTEIKEQSPFSATLTAVLNGSCEYYYPTSEIMELGGYEARSSVVKTGTGDIIINESIEILKNIYEK